jgi:formylglycine-generating enzyme required for sulfatase activity
LISELANFSANPPYGKAPKGGYRAQTTPVGQFPANPWGLHDMHGNVWAWCLDGWYGSYEGAPADGSAWLDSEDENRRFQTLLRGGSWHNSAFNCRSATRSHSLPGNANGNDTIGFRVVCLPQDPSLNA